MPGTESDRPLRGEQAADISNAVVHLMSQYTGLGPTRARTHISENLISVVLQDTLTRGERSLLENGKRELVLTTCKAFQDTMGPDLTAAVETITGRRVIAFLSDNHIDPDIAVETFILDGHQSDHT